MNEAPAARPSGCPNGGLYLLMGVFRLVLKILRFPGRRELATTDRCTYPQRSGGLFDRERGLLGGNRPPERHPEKNRRARKDRAGAGQLRVG